MRRHSEAQCLYWHRIRALAADQRVSLREARRIYRERMRRSRRAVQRAREEMGT